MPCPLAHAPGSVWIGAVILSLALQSIFFAVSVNVVHLPTSVKPYGFSDVSCVYYCYRRSGQCSPQLDICIRLLFHSKLSSFLRFPTLHISSPFFGRSFFSSCMKWWVLKWSMCNIKPADVAQVKRHERTYWIRDQKRAKLNLETKLGMHSPV